MISKSQISYIKSLQQKKFRKEHQQFIIEGDKLCDEFLNSEFVISNIYVLEAKREKYELLLSKISKKIELEVIKAEEMAKLSNFSTPSEVMALVNIPSEPAISLLTEEVLSSELVLVLDGVKDPGNMGTIIRLADWFGIQHIVCSLDSVELYNPKLVQSTMGSILRVNVYYSDLVEWMGKLHVANRYAAVLNGENIYKIEGQIKGLLVMGSESHGISKEVLTLINRPISIPSFGKAESLNVAMATGILCSEIRRRDI